MIAGCVVTAILGLCNKHTAGINDQVAITMMASARVCAAYRYTFSYFKVMQFAVSIYNKCSCKTCLFASPARTERLHSNT
jgi:hypothetical protein